jgi:hypothetical protein
VAPYAKAAPGVNVATPPEYETVPVTAAPPGAVTVKVVALIEAELIVSLKVAVIVVLTATFAEP